MEELFDAEGKLVEEHEEELEEAGYFEDELHFT